MKPLLGAVGVEPRGRVICGVFGRSTGSVFSGRSWVDKLKPSGKSFDISKWEVWEAYRQVRANQGAQLAELSDGARRNYNQRRSIWHANLPLIKTTQVTGLLEQLSDIVESNQQDGAKPKGAVAIEGPAGVGKSSAILAYAKDFHLDTIDY